jgi:hypothetical protein
MSHRMGYAWPPAKRALTSFRLGAGPGTSAPVVRARDRPAGSPGPDTGERSTPWTPLHGGMTWMEIGMP